MDNLIGVDAIELWTALVARLPDVDKLHLFELCKPPSVQKRIGFDERWNAFRDHAEQVRAVHDAPFWDALVMVAVQKGLLDEKLMDAVEFAAPTPDDFIEITRSAALSGALTDLRRNAGSPKSIAVSSCVGKEGDEDKHVPMLDLRVRVSSQARVAAVRIGRRLLPGGGVLLESGRSYHLVGFTLMMRVTLHRFLARALLWCPVVDRLYIAHHLLRGWCSLRITAGGGNERPPRVVEVFG